MKDGFQVGFSRVKALFEMQCHASCEESKNDRRDREMVLTVTSGKILTGKGWARALFFRQQLLDCRGALDAGFPFYACVLSVGVT